MAWTEELNEAELLEAEAAQSMGPGVILAEKMALWMTRNNNILDLGIDAAESVNAAIDRRLRILGKAQDLKRVRLFRDDGLM